MTAFRATSSCFICPTPARAFSRLNYFRLPYTFYFSLQRYCFFLTFPKNSSFLFIFATILLFLKRGRYSSNGVHFLPAVLFALAAGMFEYTSGGSCGVPAFPSPICVNYLRCSTIPPVVSLTIPFAQYLSIRFFCIFCINILAYIEKNPYLCSHFIGRLFGTTFRSFLVGALFNLSDEAR